MYTSPVIYSQYLHSQLQMFDSLMDSLLVVAIFPTFNLTAGVLRATVRIVIFPRFSSTFDILQNVDVDID